MEGFRNTIVAVAALAATILVGCSASRGKGSRVADRTLTAAASLPAVRTEVTQIAADDEAIRENTQQTCPVTGERLGSMGSPIPVTVGGKTIQVCCQGCVAAVKKNPDKYLKIVASERALSDAAASRVEGLYGRPTVSKSATQSTYNRPSTADHSAQSSEGHHH